MKLLELFKSAHAFDVTNDTETRFDATSTIDGKVFKFKGYKRANLGGIVKDAWEVEFGIVTGPAAPMRLDITGTGAAAKVMSFVLQMMKELIKRHPTLAGFYFTSSEKSRTDLYTAMVKRYMRDEYDVKIKKIEDDEAKFYVIRKNHEAA